MQPLQNLCKMVAGPTLLLTYVVFRQQYVLSLKTTYVDTVWQRFLNPLTSLWCFSSYRLPPFLDFTRSLSRQNRQTLLTLEPVVRLNWKWSPAIISIIDIVYSTRSWYWFTVPRRIEGWVDLDGWLGYTPKWFNCQQTVTHLSTNRTQRRVTLLIKIIMLPTR